MNDQNLEHIPKAKQILWKNCLIHLLKNHGTQYTFHQFIDDVTNHKELQAQASNQGFEEDILLFVFVFKGIGHITFQGNSKFGYAGRNAVIIKFIQFVNAIKNRLVQEGKIIENQSKAKKSSMNTEFPISFKAPKQNKKFQIEKIELRPGVYIDTKLYNYIGEFAEKVIFSILFDQNKILSKAHLKQFVDYYKGMFQGSSHFDSVIHLFKVLQYLNISVQSPTIIWQGPDYINCLGVCTDDMYQIVNNKKTLEEFLYEHVRNFNNELFNREMMFYRQLFMNDLSDVEFDQILQQFLQLEKNSQINEKTLKKLIPQLQVGYALLKFKTQNILLKKLQTILGRKNSNQQSKARWQVDINLGPSKKISKQHALILYNFEQEVFQIACLSQKYPIVVNNITVNCHDQPQSLQTGSLVTIGEENFYFLLPEYNQLINNIFFFL